VEGGDGTERDSAARWRLRAGRTAAVAALLAWCVLLVLSAWPERVFLTGLLGVPAQLADALLGRLAMTGGISVFDPPRRRIERVNLADCVFVRARDAHGAETSLHPPGGECQTGGLRLAIPRLEWVQRDLILRSTAPLNQAVIGDYWCRHAPGGRPEAVDVLWTQPWFERDTGARAHGHAVFFRWRCAPPGLTVDLRVPSDDDLRRHGVSLPRFQAPRAGDRS